MVDPVTIAVLQRRLKSITEEIGLTLLRTTRSPILNEARDFATGLYDAQGRMLEQTEYVPVLAFALQPAVESVIKAFAGDIHPGDVFLHNDVFSGATRTMTSPPCGRCSWTGRWWPGRPARGIRPTSAAR